MLCSTGKLTNNAVENVPHQPCLCLSFSFSKFFFPNFPPELGNLFPNLQPSVVAGSAHSLPLRRNRGCSAQPTTSSRTPARRAVSAKPLSWKRLLGCVLSRHQPGSFFTFAVCCSFRFSFAAAVRAVVKITRNKSQQEIYRVTQQGSNNKLLARPAYSHTDPCCLLFLQRRCSPSQTSRAHFPEHRDPSNAPIRRQ